MKNILIILVVLVHVSYSQTEYLQIFSQDYSCTAIDNQANNALIITKNNNLVLATMYCYQDTGLNNFKVSIFIKTDLNGNIIYKKTFGDSLSFLPADIIETKDGGYLLTGHSHSLFYGPLVATSCVVIKTDSVGNVLWSRLMGGNDNYGYKVAELNDSTYCGIATDSANTGDIFYYVVSKSGTFKFGKTIGSTGTESPHSVICSNGYSYILANTINSFDTVNQVMLSKVNSNGNIIWTKTYSFVGNQASGSFLIKKSPNLFCISGIYSTNTTNSTFVLEIDSTGNPLNAKSYEIDTLDEVTSLASNNNNGYLLNILSNPLTQYGSFYSVILDNNLNITYKNKLNVNSISGIGSMGPTILRKNNNIFAGGIAYDNSPLSAFPFILKLDTTGAYPCSDSGASITTLTLNVIAQSRILSSNDKSQYRIIADTLYNIPIPDSIACSNTTSIKNIYQSGSLIKIYPNPTSDQFFIDANATDKLNVDLYDVNGRHVFSANVSDKENINVATLDNGAYTLTIKTADRVINKKLVILR